MAQRLMKNLFANMFLATIADGNVHNNLDALNENVCELRK